MEVNKEQMKVWVETLNMYNDELRGKQLNENQDFEKVDNIEKWCKEKNFDWKEVYKFQKVNARPAKPGEKITTKLSDGTMETDERTAEEGDWIVSNVDGGGEEWIVKGDKFEKKYEKTDKDGIFKPKGGPMLAFQLPVSVEFKPPMWGGDVQRIVAGGWLLKDKTNKKDIYGIGEKEFEETYRMVHRHVEQGQYDYIVRLDDVMKRFGMSVVVDSYKYAYLDIVEISIMKDGHYVWWRKNPRDEWLYSSFKFDKLNLTSSEFTRVLANSVISTRKDDQAPELVFPDCSDMDVLVERLKARADIDDFGRIMQRYGVELRITPPGARSQSSLQELAFLVDKTFFIMEMRCNGYGMMYASEGCSPGVAKHHDRNHRDAIYTDAIWGAPPECLESEFLSDIVRLSGCEMMSTNMDDDRIFVFPDFSSVAELKMKLDLGWEPVRKTIRSTT